MTSSAAVQEWIRIHRLLLEREAAFTDLAMLAAAGKVSPEDLAEHRKVLMGLRESCTAAYEKAFPEAARPARPHPPGDAAGRSA